MVETIEAPPVPLAHYEGGVSSDVVDAPPVEHVLINNLMAPNTRINQVAVDFSRRLNESYYRGQAAQFGFWLPLDPSRINGVAYPVRNEPRREDFNSDVAFEEARSEFADALSSQEKHALSGVPFN